MNPFAEAGLFGNNVMLNTLNSAYKILHLSGYCDEIENADVVKTGLAEAKIIIDKIKPTNLNDPTA